MLLSDVLSETILLVDPPQRVTVKKNPVGGFQRTCDGYTSVLCWELLHVISKL